MKVHGLVRNCPAILLVDSGSSHNFVDISLVKQLQGQLDTSHTFNVKIADGGSVVSKGVLCSGSY